MSCRARASGLRQAGSSWLDLVAFVEQFVQVGTTRETASCSSCPVDAAPLQIFVSRRAEEASQASGEEEALSFGEQLVAHQERRCFYTP